MVMTEYEIRLYSPQSTRPLFFSRAPSQGAAQSMARRWQAANPECRVHVVETDAPRPRSVGGAEISAN
jgi:hypothetical protein